RLLALALHAREELVVRTAARLGRWLVGDRLFRRRRGRGDRLGHVERELHVGNRGRAEARLVVNHRRRLRNVRIVRRPGLGRLREGLRELLRIEASLSRGALLAAVERRELRREIASAERLGQRVWRRRAGRAELLEAGERVFRRTVGLELHHAAE